MDAYSLFKLSFAAGDWSSGKIIQLNVEVPEALYASAFSRRV